MIQLVHPRSNSQCDSLQVSYDTSPYSSRDYLPMRIHRVRSVSEGIRHPRIESDGERRTDRATSRREIISPAPLLLVMMFADSEVDQNV